MNATTLPVAPGGPHPLLRALASTRLTLVALAAIAAGVVANAQVEGGMPVLLAAVFALGAANLLAALVAQPRLRADLPLFVFHVALLAILALAAAGRLMALTGTAELANGEVFDGQLLTREAGPLHPDRLQRLRFVNDGFTIEYAEGWRRGRTANQVRVFGGSGEVTRLVIGDIDALVLDGYRFYTTPNKGFAPVFRWVPRDGEAMQRGAVHLPAYPMHEHAQAQTWRIPGTGRDAWIMLDLDRPAIDPTRESGFRVPESYRLVAVIDGVRRELAAGESVALPEGVLVFEGLTTWMGYKVYYDPTLSWMLAASLLAVASLAVFCWRRFGRAAAGRSA
jgi:cytochrome c biogenesis protein